jgi:hypothetical protein
MKTSIRGGILVLAVALLVPQTVRAQGTLAYLSNVGQASSGSVTVGSDLWLAALFGTGNNAGGYTLDSIQLGMADALGNPSNFTVMLYSEIPLGAILPGNKFGTLDGSLNPTTAGVYTFTPVLNLTLSPNTDYFIVLTAGTTVANGAYGWSYASAISYNPTGGWGSYGGIWSSGNGSTWNSPAAGNPQFAINATAIPEPGVLGLFGLGGLAFLWHRRKAKSV